MLLINIACFLLIAAIFLAIYKPQSKSDAWLFGIIIPMVLFLLVFVFNRFTSRPDTKFSLLLVSTLGYCLPSIIITFFVLFIFLKKKYVMKEQFKFPKGLIVSIIVLLALGVLSECGYHMRDRATAENDTKNVIGKATNNKTQSHPMDKATIDARKLLQKEITSTNSRLPITEAGFSFISMELKGSALICHFTIDENELNFDDYIQHIDRNKSSYFRQSTGHNPSFVKTLLASGYDWTLILVGKQTGKTKTISLSARELKDAVKEKGLF